MKTVTFVSRDWMTVIKEPTNVISIGEPGESIPEFPCTHTRMLRLEFDDIEQDLGPGYNIFDFTHASKIFKFVETCGDEDILVHCHAGASRSAAVAIFLQIFRGYFLDLSSPCGGNTNRFNREVYRVLRLAHIQALPVQKGKIYVKHTKMPGTP